jgi:FAD/FMN-containing dehydrogenase
MNSISGKGIGNQMTTSAIQANQDFVHALGRALSEVRFDHMARLLYSTDASIYQMMPVGVAIPRDVDEIVAAVEIARAHGVPVLPRGGGSSLAGQAVGHALSWTFPATWTGSWRSVLKRGS